MTAVAPASFTEWLVSIGELRPGQKWALARRTPGLVSRYGEDARFLGKAEYARLDERHRVARRDDALAALAAGHGVADRDIPALAAAFELGRTFR